jgi:NACHT domain
MADTSQKQEVGDVEAKQKGVVQIGQAGRYLLQVVLNFGNFGQRKRDEIDWEIAAKLMERQVTDVENRLEQMLFGIAAIGLTPTPQEVAKLAATKILTIEQANPEIIDPTRPILEVYDRASIKGSLLILGTPGAGKTTTLLSLAQQLIERELINLQEQSPKTVIPLIFELSAWRDDQQSIGDWLVAQLYENYGGDRRSGVYETWLKKQVLLPLLDGLDELGLVRQQKCTEQINQFAHQYPQLVVCCRVKEFRQVGVKLSNLNGAVKLEPLSDRQIQSYLVEVGKSALWEQIQTVPEMGRLLEPVNPLDPDRDEPGLLRVPLFISLAAQVFKADRPLSGKADLLDQYIDRQLSWDVRMADRSRKEFKNRRWEFTTVEQEPGRHEVQHSLVWMARQLKWRYQVELLIEKIQPRWLASKQKLWWYRLTFSLIFGLFTSPFNNIASSPGQHPLTGFMGMSVLGYFCFSQDLIEPTEDFSFKKPAIIRTILSGFIAYFIIVLIAILIRGPVSGLIASTLFGLPLSLLGAMFTLCKKDFKTRLKPNQGMRESARKTILTAVLYYPFAVLGVIGISNTSDKLANLVLQGISPMEILLVVKVEFLKSTFTGIGATLLFGILVGGGKACLQHISLRLLLTFSDRVIPWNLAQFLTYCHERRLLQQIGGRYRFIHRELLDHFAAMPDRPN